MIIQAGSSIVSPLQKRGVLEANNDFTDHNPLDVLRNSTPLPIQDYQYEMEVEENIEPFNYPTEFSDNDEIEEEMPLRTTRSTRSSSRLKDPQLSEDEEWIPEKVKVVKNAEVRRRPNIKKVKGKLPKLPDQDEEEEEEIN